MKILCVSSNRHPGVSSVFKNFIGVAPNSGHMFLEDLKENFDDGFDLVIIGAWDSSLAELVPKIKCKKAVLWTSSVMQSVQTPDSIEFQLLNEVLNKVDSGELNYVFFGDNDFCTYLKMNNKRIYEFPYPIFLKNIDKRIIKEKPKKDIFLFTVSALRKNIHNQFYGFELANRICKRLVLNTNVIGEGIPNVIPYSWLSEEDYNKLLLEQDIGLNIFPNESFCYSFLELMSKGIPTLCSIRIANNFNLSSNERLYELLVVNDCDSCLEISEKLYNLTNHLTQRVSDMCIEHMKKFAEENNKKLIIMLDSLN